MTSVDITKLLDELEDVTQPFAQLTPRHLDLCRRAKLAIQELQQEQRRVINNVGLAFERVGKALQNHG